MPEDEAEDEGCGAEGGSGKSISGGMVEWW